MKYFISVLLILVIFPTAIFTQSTSKNSISDEYADSSKNYWVAVPEIVGLNILVWGNNRYIAEEDWAKISYETISGNFEKGFTWDSDSFAMNQFFHPYHGAAYYNIARTNGFSFWESAPFALGGSLMWEYAMEVEPPSYNDLLNTTLSGIMLGEIMYRLSGVVLDESTSGFERFSRELTATLIDPVRGFNRFVKGKMWRSGVSKINPKLAFNFSIGANAIFKDGQVSQRNPYILTMFDINYGKKWQVRNHKKPFDYIRIHGEISSSKEDDIIGISTSGVLWDWKFSLLENEKNYFGLYKEFDYLENSIYKFSSASLAAIFTNKTAISNSVLLQASVGVSTVFIGGSNSIYSSEVGKNYNLGPGLGARINIQAIILKKLLVSIKYKQFWIHVLNGLSGEEFIGLHRLGLSYQLFTNLAVGTNFILYERYGVYTKYLDIHSTNTSLRLFLKYTL